MGLLVKRTKNKSMRNVTINNSYNKKGYLIKFYKKSYTPSHEKMFLIKDYDNNWIKALKEAKKWRDMMVIKLGYNLKTRNLRIVPYKNSKSGILGIYRYIVRCKKSNHEYPCWIAFITRVTKNDSKSRFYDHKCGGSEKAKELAIKWRSEMIEKLKSGEIS